MKVKDLRALTDDELKQKEVSFKHDLLNFRFKANSGTLEKPSQIGQTKKDIAKIETILRERENEGKKK